MQIVFGLRGIKHEAEKFINELSTRYLPFKIYNKEKKQLEKVLLQMRVCPIQLYDVSFPKEHMDSVLTTLYGGSEGVPRSVNKWMEKLTYFLRKLLGLKSLPKYKTDTHLMMDFPQHTEIFSIGVKEDYWITEEGKHVDEKNKTPLSYEGI